MSLALAPAQAAPQAAPRQAPPRPASQGSDAPAQNRPALTLVADDLPTVPRMGEGACQDVPATVGWMIVGSYGAILGAFAWAFWGAGDVMFNLGVCAVYLAMYLGVPWVFLKAEPHVGQIQRPDFADFLERGLSTWTGHVSGASALAQILTIPVALTFAALGIGLIIRLSV